MSLNTYLYSELEGRGERILSIVNNNEIKMFFQADDECEGSSRGDSPLHYQRSADWNVEPLGERRERGRALLKCQQ